MKKLMLALTAVAAFTGSAMAADLAPRPYTKAPPPVVAPVASWTGCYLAGGGGGAFARRRHQDLDVGGFPLSNAADAGMTGWFGTVEGGCDYQFGGNWVVGAFANYDFSDINGQYNLTNQLRIANLKQDQAWAAGGRVGYVVLPQLLSFVSAGYTQAHVKSSTFATNFGVPVPDTLPGRWHNGWFVGAGDEYALTFFLPGLFWKTEYRYTRFDTVTSPILLTTTATFFDRSRTDEHAVRSELVYRFNWGAPLVARY
jgi:outer membrane immunogenic protein